MEHSHGVPRVLTTPCPPCRVLGPLNVAFVWAWATCCLSTWEGREGDAGWPEPSLSGHRRWVGFHGDSTFPRQQVVPQDTMVVPRKGPPATGRRSDVLPHH